MKHNDEHLTAIGRVTVMHTKLEFLVSHLASRLLSADERIADIVMPQMFGRKLELLRRLVDLHASSDGRREFDSVAKELRDASEARNEIIHAFVWGQLKTLSGESVPAVFNKKMDAKPMPVEEVNKIADRLDAASKRLFVFSQRTFPNL